jgi:hypothetical protein
MWTFDDVMWYSEPSAAAAAGFVEGFMAAGVVVAVVMTKPERLNGAEPAAERDHVRRQNEQKTEP